MTYLLDTNAIIYLLSGKTPWRPEPSALLVTSILTHVELLGWSRISDGEHESIRRFLGSVATRPVNGGILDAAIGLRREHRLKTIDAIIAATSVIEGAVLVTNDRDLRRIGSVKCLPLPLL